MAKRRQLMDIASNLFLDSKRIVWPRPTASKLVLLGNTGKLTSNKTMDFLKYAKKEWDTVIFVPSARDYSVDSPDGPAFWQLMDAVKSEGIIYGERGEIEISTGNVLLTCSLWTDTPFRSKDPVDFEPYKQILLQKGKYAKSLDIAEWFWEDRAWLKGRLCHLRTRGFGVSVATVESPIDSFQNILEKKDSPLQSWIWPNGASLKGTGNPQLR